jgi:hypothetical protein
VSGDTTVTRSHQAEKTSKGDFTVKVAFTTHCTKHERNTSLSGAKRMLFGAEPTTKVRDFGVFIRTDDAQPVLVSLRKLYAMGMPRARSRAIHEKVVGRHLICQGASSKSRQAQRAKSWRDIQHAVNEPEKYMEGESACYGDRDE